MNFNFKTFVAPVAAVTLAFSGAAQAEMLNQTGQHYTGGNSYNFGKYYDQPSYKQKPWKGTQIRDRQGNSWNCPTYSTTCRPE